MVLMTTIGNGPATAGLCRLVTVVAASFVVGVATLGIGTTTVRKRSNRRERKDSSNNERNNFHQANSMRSFYRRNLPPRTEYGYLPSSNKSLRVQLWVSR